MTVHSAHKSTEESFIVSVEALFLLLFLSPQATGSRIGTIIQALTTLGIGISISLYFDWRLGLVSIPFVPFVLIAVYFQSKILMGQSVTESKALQDAGKVRFLVCFFFVFKFWHVHRFSVSTSLVSSLVRNEVLYKTELSQKFLKILFTSICIDLS